MSDHHRFHFMRPRPQRGWSEGNAVDLLENGEEFFPAVLEAIEQARREILIETFILFEDQVGQALQRALVAAARRGVSVDVLVDGYGSADLSKRYLDALQGAGVRLRAFDPQPRLFGRLRWNLFRRMHRKIVVVDGEVAFVGGINYGEDHLTSFGPEAKQDYSVRVRGPIVATIQAFARAQVRAQGRRDVPQPPPPAGPARVMFVTRDNTRHRDDIERQYRAAIRAARREVLIANAYFFPGYRLLKTMRQAARRGVRVRLVLQGQPDMPIVKTAAMLLHKQLIAAGVEIHEYCERPMHAKVAVIDDEWSTVGSSNLDPLSLSLNLEANVIVRDAQFAAVLRERLERLVARHCTQVARPPEGRNRPLLFPLLEALAYHFTRRFPAWAGWLPEHKPQVGALPPSEKPSLGALGVERPQGGEEARRA